jgi:DNA-binding CsgD family transcriptional regulator
MGRSDDQPGRAHRLLEPWIELNRAWVEMAQGYLGSAAECASRAAELARETRQYSVEAIALYDAVRLGYPGDLSRRLAELSAMVDGQLVVAFADAAAALRARDGRRLDKVAATFEGLGLMLHAAEAAAAAARCHSAAGQVRQANASRERMIALADMCEGTRTPLLDADCMSVLTGRQREIAIMAASGLTSKTIASRLGLSVRTVDNHLARSYLKLGVTRREQLAAIVGQLSDSPGHHQSPRCSEG